MQELIECFYIKIWELNKLRNHIIIKTFGNGGIGGPALTVGGIPTGAAKVTVRLTDLNMPNFTQGGDVFVPPAGRIPPGTLPNYAGPCPPTGERHTFRFIVDALDASGRVIATGQATRPFPPE
jgi:hypothetical protein